VLLSSMVGYAPTEVTIAGALAHRYGPPSRKGGVAAETRSHCRIPTPIIGLI